MAKGMEFMSFLFSDTPPRCFLEGAPSAPLIKDLSRRSTCEPQITFLQWFVSCKGSSNCWCYGKGVKCLTHIHIYLQEVILEMPIREQYISSALPINTRLNQERGIDLKA